MLFFLFWANLSVQNIEFKCHHKHLTRGILVDYFRLFVVKTASESNQKMPQSQTNQ